MLELRSDHATDAGPVLAAEDGPTAYLGLVGPGLVGLADPDPDLLDPVRVRYFGSTG